MPNSELLCLIVDDDEMVRLDLEQRLQQWPGIKFAGSCGTAMEATQFLSEQSIGLIFLDIQLPGMSGLSFVKSIELSQTQVILITANRDYAADAFEFDVTDFLVKPFSDERFMKAMLRVNKKRQSAGNVQQGNTDHIFVKVNSVLEKIVLAEIQYVEAMADYVNIQTSARRYTVHATMKSIESSLPSTEFMRVHNSFIVRMDQIARVEDNAVLIGQKVIPVSRAKQKPLMERLNLL